ncbi:MAG: Gfo/Idh/MocA family oxidoreductase [Kiritimatiellae bacterium]|nr:Gfo/Idh/MocA family oxidoreductase [Kiritimatiellia bacterium]
MTKRLRIGAAGWFTNDQGPDYETVAFCDINAERLRKLGAEHPHMKMYSDFREMLKHPGLGAVIISTPNFMHAEQAIAALDAGMHVFLEKPMGINLEECKAIVAAQARAGKNLTVDFEMRHSPFARRIKEFIEGGEFGRLLRIEFIHHRGGWLEQGNGIWRTRPERSGGMYFMEPIHEVDIFRFFAGEVKWVQSTVGPNSLPQYRFQDNVCTHLAFENGVMGMIYTTHSHSASPTDTAHWRNTSEYMRGMGHDMSMIFSFERASVGADMLASKIIINRLEEWPVGSGGCRVVQDRIEDFSRGSEHGDFFHDIAAMRLEFIRRCAGGREPLQAPRDILRTHQVCLAAEQSAREDFRRVNVDYRE